MKTYKGVIFFDVDGTIIDCANGINVPTKKTRESIKKLKESGYLTILATGRPMSFVNKDLLNLGLHGYIASNGSYAKIEDEIIFDYPIENSMLAELVEYFHENKIDYILEGQEASYVLNLDGDKMKAIIKDSGLGDARFIDKWDIKTVRTNKIVVVLNDENMYKKIQEKYKNKYAFMIHPGGNSFEIYIGKYTKGYGIEQLIKKLGINQEDTYAFGDGENDIEMFQVVKHGIAMGGYHARLEEHAYDFTENVENEGIYEGLKKLKLI
ncbi:HAD family hydrolase [Clostridium gasigenes]|uniref:HAD family hydrolase n=1 Tax=Clostridium gasigenes TaxID=94869 RepID=UPI0014382F75|nr:HAD family hydrolase [Clostridium gasigenes]MBU3137593.1 HAD family hydrolase [Clostridium gasigenes]NKF08477.1 HAD family hydrolase [Clostridium gasigenes]QSW21292.1 HAD family hydrolase [Clostridium gasigenes]